MSAARRSGWVVLVALAACAPSSPPHATAADASRANVGLAELEHGRSILVRKCGNCHKAPRPGDDWRPHMPEMAVRANLDAEQERLIVQYLTVMAYAP